MEYLAQAPTFWNGANGSSELWLKIAVAFVVGLLIMFGLMSVPAQFRRAVVAAATFLAGLTYILYWLWPEPIGRQPGTLPSGSIEGVGFFLDDSQQVIGNFYNILSGLLLGLGVYSILRIHTRKLVRQQQDWAFSGVLLLGMLLMIIFGFWDFHDHAGPGAALLDNPANWHWQNYTADFLFDGLLQTMDAGMFSVIAFYILSAAYRAFRIRSIEATILLATAVIVMLSLMGAISYLSTKGINAMSPTLANGQPDTGAFIQNFSLANISQWLQDTLQTSSIRGIDFGVGIGALAMAMRLWLSLERGGVSQ